MSGKINLLILTQLFPNSISPTMGVFVLNRVLELKKYYNISLVSPIPWFPNIEILKKIFPKQYRYSKIPYTETINGIFVYHPRYFSFPKKYLFFLKGFFYKLGVQKTIKAINQNQNISLIHTHFAYPDSYAGSLINKKYSLPLITTVHGSDINEYLQSKSIRKLVQKTFSSAHKIIAVSNNLKDKLLKLNIREEKVSVIPNGFNPNYFKPLEKVKSRKELKLPQDKKIILFVGNLVPVKGLEYLIDAFGLIHVKLNDALLIIIGKGDQKKYHPQLKKHEILNSVQFTDTIPHENIGKWMASSDVLVLPSLEEGQGAVLIESMACGVPVVASRIGGIPDIVKPENGLLCAPESANDLSEKIVQALKKDWNKDVITASVQEFKWEKIIRKEMELYESLLN